MSNAILFALSDDEEIFLFLRKAGLSDLPSAQSSSTAMRGNELDRATAFKPSGERRKKVFSVRERPQQSSEQAESPIILSQSLWSTSHLYNFDQTPSYRVRLGFSFQGVSVGQGKILEMIRMPRLGFLVLFLLASSAGEDEVTAVVAVDGEPAMGVPADDNSEGREELDTSHLGPVIIRKDGTMGRIQGWATLGEREQAKILEMVQKRNAKRREEL